MTDSEVHKQGPEQKEHREEVEEPEEHAELKDHRQASESTADDEDMQSIEFWPSRPDYMNRNISHVTSRRSVMNERAESVISRIRSRKPTAPFKHPLARQKTTEEAVVHFDGPKDPYMPMNWETKKKIMTTMLYGLTTMGSAFSSSVYSPGVAQIAAEFKVSNIVSTLGLTMFLLGLGLGPLIWAPLSEIYGRKMAVLIPYFIAAIFSFACGASKDIQTIMLTRFWGGFFASAPVTNTGGVLGDIWSAEHRGVAMVGYAMAVVGGPALGPIVGGAIVQSYLGWRWTEYITGIYMMLMLVLGIIFLDESYAPVLLVYKARRLRHETGNWALHAKHEEWDVSLVELCNKYLIRPLQMVTTPICFLIALYASFVYGILYAQLASFPIEFQEVRGWGQVVGALPFLAMLIGIFIGGALNLFNQKYYIKHFRANGNRAVPEARLPPMMIGSVVFAAGLFIFAWTSDKKIFWLAPCIGIALVGMGFFTIFQAALNYLVDTFQTYAASAVAANTLLRSIFAAAFPLFITPMLHNLGIGWGVSIFGFIAIGMIPIPYLFFIYGKRIRARGVWSRESI
jgi:multidrug resistance protein